MARTAAPKGWDHIHRILGVAMRAAPKEAWPARPHFDGPLPVLSTRRQVDVALAVCDFARPFASADERAEVERLRGLVDDIVGAGKKRFTKSVMNERNALDKASKTSKRDTPIIRVAKLTVRAALNDRWAAPSARNAVGTCIENAAEALVATLGVDDARSFLVLVDQSIIRNELEAMLFDKGLESTVKIARVLSRPKATKGKSLGLAFAELADGGYGVFVKLKNRWQWHVANDRATAFAYVPDEYMEQVIEDIEPKARLRATIRKSRA